MRVTLVNGAQSCPRPRRASRLVEKAEALGRRAALPARAPLGARAAIGAAPALDLDLERFASPVAHHAAAEIPSAVPGAPPRLLLRSRFGRHVVVSLGEALHTRGHSWASDLSGYAVVSSGDVVCKACRQSAAPGRLSREPPLVVRRRDTMAFETAIAQTGSGTA